MELFSRRYGRDSRIKFMLERRHGLLPLGAKNRLQSLVKFFVESGKFLEPFLLEKIVSRNIETYCLNSVSLKDLSLRELGYDMTRVVDCERLNFELEEFDDMKFFDLIEILVIFSLKSERANIIRRIQQTFSEEQIPFILNGFMIMRSDGNNLDSIAPILKNKSISQRVIDYFEEGGWQTRARITADLLQTIFSSPDGQGDTKSYCEGLCKKIAKKWTHNEKVDELSALLNQAVKNAKDLSNRIADIRHTDTHTIPITGPDFYRTIAMNNMGVVELAIFSLPEDYIVAQDPEQLKDQYLSEYSIDRIKQLVRDDDALRIEDIPF